MNFRDILARLILTVLIFNLVLSLLNLQISVIEIQLPPVIENYRL